MSEIKVNKISQRSGTAITLGNSGTDFQLPSGADIVAQSGSTITIAAGATITNSGTATGFGATYNGAVNWDTTPKTTTVTAASGVGYFINTSGGAITLNLPVGVAGAIVSVADYTNSFQTNALTIAPNGLEKINGGVGAIILNTEGQSLTLIYVDGTEGWKSVQGSTTSPVGNNFIVATGGTITTSGDYKTHIFTGPGTFTVTCAGNPLGSSSVDYLVVAGGGGSGRTGGGGGAGGFRSYSSLPSVSPLNGPASLPVSVQGYPITVGAGGPAGTCDGVPSAPQKGSDSVFSTITSTGGGGGQNYSAVNGAGAGGSGGGAGPTGPASSSGASGNTPPVAPSQGSSGGNSTSPNGNRGGAGGGGAGASGTIGTAGVGGAGGVGSYLSDSFFGPTAPSYGTPGPVGSTRYFAGGGGGCANPCASVVPGGAGGGGTGGGAPAGPKPGVVNTGGGAGATNNVNGAAGGSGIVVIRYKFQ